MFYYRRPIQPFVYYHIAPNFKQQIRNCINVINSFFCQRSDDDARFSFWNISTNKKQHSPRQRHLAVIHQNVDVVSFYSRVYSSYYLINSLVNDHRGEGEIKYERKKRKEPIAQWESKEWIAIYFYFFIATLYFQWNNTCTSTIGYYSPLPVLPACRTLFVFHFFTTAIDGRRRKKHSSRAYCTCCCLLTIETILKQLPCCCSAAAFTCMLLWDM